VFKRLRWLTLGALAGVSGSIWVQRRLHQAIERVTPQQLGHQVRRRVGRVSDDLRASVREGRTAMAEREAELRARLPDGVTPLPGALSSGRGRVIDAVAVEDHGGGGPGRSDGRHPSSAPPEPADRVLGQESTVTELSAARRSRPERRRRRR
jgi:hypothetical protein